MKSLVRKGDVDPFVEKRTSREHTVLWETDKKKNTPSFYCSADTQYHSFIKPIKCKQSHLCKWIQSCGNIKPQTNVNPFKPGDLKTTQVHTDSSQLWRKTSCLWWAAADVAIIQGDSYVDTGHLHCLLI